MPRSVDRIPRGASRVPRFPYCANPPYPNARQGNVGPYIMDAVSGVLFPERFAVSGPFGLVDGRVGSVVDRDGDLHEMAVTMRGPQPTWGYGNLGVPTSGPGAAVAPPAPDPPPPDPPAAGTNYYVSPSGDGTQTGVDEANAMSLAALELYVLSALNPGDTVWFADGVYTKTISGINIQRNGEGTAGTYTSTSPITFRAINPRQAHFQGPDYSGGPSTLTSFRMFQINGDDIHLIGLKISRAPLDGIRINAKRCMIDNCYLLRCGKIRSGSQDGGEGIMVSGYGNFSTIKNSLFSENREHHIYYAGEVTDAICGGSIADGNIFRFGGYDWDDTPAKTSGTAGIQANGAGPGTGCRRITIRGNRIYYSSDNAILFLETHDSTITENYCYGNDGEQIQVSVTSTNNTVSDNEVASDTRACIADAGGSSGHIITGNRCWTEALTNTANVTIEYKNAANIATSANNIFHHQGPSVARNDNVSPVDYFTLAEYQAEVSDATSTEITDGTITQFDADIQAWINGGGGVLLPPDPAA